jgi:hypothetical protein
MAVDSKFGSVLIVLEALMESINCIPVDIQTRQPSDQVIDAMTSYSVRTLRRAAEGT